MSLGAIRSGNYHKLRNCVGHSCNVRLLKLHKGLISGKVVDARQCQLRPLIATVEVRSQKSESHKSCSLNRNLHGGSVGTSIDIDSKLGLQQLKPIECFSLPEKISKIKVEQPATILVFDIETTGFSRQKERIIEFASRDLIGGQNSTFQTLVNPEKDVKNAYVHGISSHMVNRRDVPRFGELVPILLQYVRSRQMVGKPVLWIAHNGRRFDVPFITYEFHRCSAEIPPDWLFLDTLPLARQLVNPDGTKLSSFSLEALRVHYGIPSVGPSHRAMQDVMTLCSVLQRMTFDLKLTVPDLLDHAFQASDTITQPKLSN